ncbi:hypothetical protein [Flavisphingomonas formosensis]|uniref:hypothetical protein n=1 Tax=Flavisphingomonas formosensis TaxID=861534 RepID=UPI0012FC9254|nr:hypothetical protein [Sphingomonas formosensis]
MVDVVDMGTSRAFEDAASTEPAITVNPTTAAPANSVRASGAAQAMEAASASAVSILTEAITRYEGVLAEASEWGRSVMQAAYDGAKAEIAAIPHKTTKASYESNSGVRHLSTSDETSVAIAQGVVERADSHIAGGRADWVEASRELMALLAEREHEKQRIDQRYKLDELSDEEIRRGDALCKLAVAIYAIPATNFADVFTKLAFHREHGVLDDRDALEAVEADLRRLAAAGAVMSANSDSPEWIAAERALAETKAKVALAESESDIDDAADAMTEAELALMALPTTNARQMLRKLVVAWKGGELAAVNHHALWDEVERLAAAEVL